MVRSFGRPSLIMSCVPISTASLFMRMIMGLPFMVFVIMIVRPVFIGMFVIMTGLFPLMCVRVTVFMVVRVCVGMLVFMFVFFIPMVVQVLMFMGVFVFVLMCVFVVPFHVKTSFPSLNPTSQITL